MPTRSTAAAAVLVVLSAGAARPARALEGWAVFANGGNVYRCSVGGAPELLHSGEAEHACWSADGMYVCSITTAGEIWTMYNDGTDPKVLTTGTNTIHCPIAPYRPDPEYVLYVEGTKFYKIGRSDGSKAEIHADTQSFTGEIAISTDGTRMAARYGDWLYKIVVGTDSETYAPRCSSSISPDGGYLTKNWDGHIEMTVYTWGASVHKTLWCDSLGITWDNQKFAANSSDHIVYKIDSGAGAVGVVCVSTEENWQVCDIISEFPDFFLGSLPDPDPGRPDGGGGCAPGAPGGLLALCVLVPCLTLRRRSRPG